MQKLQASAVQKLINLGQAIIMGLGLLCICLACALISAIIYVVFFVISPMVFPTVSLGSLFHYPFVMWVASNIMFNYVMSLAVAPGSPESHFTDNASNAGHVDDDDRSKGGWSRFCKKCNKPKPPRAHHCHMCGHCVLKMDHHCPWINACVGHRNQRYFLLFLVYLWFGTLYVSMVLFLCNMGLVGSMSNVFGTPSLLFTFVLCVAIFFAMSFFVAWNAHLSLSNQTTVEWHGNKMREKEARNRGDIFWNQYNLGRRRNLQQIFGPFRQWWQILLPSMSPLDSNGHAFPTMMEMRSVV